VLPQIQRSGFDSRRYYIREVKSATNRNEYQKSSFAVKVGRIVSLITSLSSVSRLSIKYGSLDVPKPYRPPQPFTRVKKAIPVIGRGIL
jgi:hypothetical protein